MKRLLCAAVLAVLAAPALAEVGFSMEVGHPGFYGRIEVGGFPEPQLIFPRPVIIERVVIPRPPIYLHVPPGHAKHWEKHCHKYDACGRRAYFVEESWYRNVYVPRWQARHGGGPDDDRGSDKGGKGKSKGKGKGHKD